jgi:hypothetical protein
MNFDLQRMLQSKETLRKRLASRPVSEKLAMLDALREGTLAIRKAAQSRTSSAGAKKK